MIKKILLSSILIGSVCGIVAAQEPAKEPAVSTENRPLAMYMRPTKEQRKIFKQRNKEIRRLVKAYRKADTAQKLVIKEQLFRIVSEATDESLAFAQQRLSAEKANLAQWEKILQQRSAQREEIKARRVDEILSGEAKRRYELAKKRWKKEIKEFKKSMK